MHIPLLAIAAALLLLGMSALPTRGRTTFPVLLPLAVVAGLCMSAALIRLTVTELGYRPQSWSLKLAESVQRRLAAVADDDGAQDVLLMEGGSYSARGIDGAMLERLASNRYPSLRVVQVSLDGANHFERSWVMRLAWSQLTDEQKEKLRNKNVILLMEIQRGYDTDPVNGLVRNSGTDRTYAYMSPGNAIDAMTAIWSEVPRQIPATDAIRTTLVVVKHALVNALNIGLFDRGTALSDVSPMSSYRPLSKAKRGFKFSYLTRDGRNTDVEEPTSWSLKLRPKRFARLLPGSVDHLAYYSVISTEWEDLEYVKKYCSMAGDVPCVRYDDPALLKSLSHRRFWNDGRHMRGSGARRFTRWFARRLLRDLERSNYL